MQLKLGRFWIMLRKSSIVLGDNPFFAISHAGFDKSKEYLQANEHLAQCVEVVKLAGKNGINTMMISNHESTAEFLNRCGYSRSEQIDLPSIAFVIPNVHQQNVESVKNGFVAIIINIAKRVFSKIVLHPVKFLKNPILSIISEFINIQLEGVNKNKVEYIFVHNIYVDLLLGLRAFKIINAFIDAIRFAGFKPGLITMNPVKLDKVRLNDVNVCVYYNLNGYNMVSNYKTILGLKKFDNVKLWAMGILASGTISIEEATNDEKIEHFDHIIYATGKPNRLSEFLRSLT